MPAEPAPNQYPKYSVRCLGLLHLVRARAVVKFTPPAMPCKTRPTKYMPTNKRPCSGSDVAPAPTSCTTLPKKVKAPCQMYTVFSLSTPTKKRIGKATPTPAAHEAMSMPESTLPPPAMSATALEVGMAIVKTTLQTKAKTKAGATIQVDGALSCSSSSCVTSPASSSESGWPSEEAEAAPSSSSGGVNRCSRKRRSTTNKTTEAVKGKTAKRMKPNCKLRAGEGTC
mmetsp:Transcript_7399/g.16244  ORF Transcript_7399/g.16244 Transcript_7399/m.16244 type:complete len:227 (-) Transcript_7399:197-877(-)